MVVDGKLMKWTFVGFERLHTYGLRLKRLGSGPIAGGLWRD